jgi:hypothetical protein
MPLEPPSLDGPVPTLAGEVVEVRVHRQHRQGRGGRPPTVDSPRPRHRRSPGAPELTFGDGPHRCPGASIAIPETGIFPSRLFTVNGIRMTGGPLVSPKNDIRSHEDSDLVVIVDRR